ncbi:MAG: hypothetical protein LBU75_00020 [Desulfovibrio sp.]|jgi:hypothetical protein|nr:hypothetical protein [Desulfovibrio sp.]
MRISVDVEATLPDTLRGPEGGTGPQAAREELGVIAGAARGLADVVRIARILVPEDFGATLAELAPDRHAPRPRAGSSASATPTAPAASTAPTASTGPAAPTAPSAMTAAIPAPQGWVLVFHPGIYGPEHDAHMRYALYWRELTRLVNKGRLPVPLRAADGTLRQDRHAVLLTAVSRLFGEYDAARKAWDFRDGLLRKVLRQELSERARTALLHAFAADLGHATSADARTWLRMLADDHARTGDTATYLRAVRPLVMRLSLALSHAWATLDHFPDLAAPGAELLHRAELPAAARELHTFFRNRHVAGSPDMEPGTELLAALWAGFGLRLADGPDSSGGSGRLTALRPGD